MEIAPRIFLNTPRKNTINKALTPTATPVRGPGLGRSSPSLIQPHAHAQPRRQLTAALRGAAQVKYKFPPIDRKKVGRCEFSSSAMGQARAHAEAHRSGPP